MSRLRVLAISALALLCTGLMAAFLLGHGHAEPADRFIPAEDSARAALESALKAWQDGDSSGHLRLDVGPPVVQVTDSYRRAGQSLRNFDILGKTSTEGPHHFAVRLFLDHPREEKTVRYVVVGVDPLWVMREDDFEMLARWQMYMGDRASPKKARN
jgi:hypothetical protein